MPTPVSNVYPGSSTYTHEVALRRPNGQTWGLRLQEGARSLQDSAPQTNAPFDFLSQYSFHLGRGAENFLGDKHMAFWDSANAWTLTPSKLHPSMLMQWTRGIYYQEFHWLQTGVENEYTDIVWKKIGAVGDPYLSYAHLVILGSPSSTRIEFYVRRHGNPSPLTVELVSDSGGNPTGSVRQSLTVTTADITDSTVTLFEGTVAAFSFTLGTTYHIKFYATASSKENCWEIGCNPDVAGKRSSDNTTYTATTYAPYFRIAPVAAGVYFPFQYDGASYLLNTGNQLVYINGGRGKATSGGVNYLQDTALTMYVNRYKNAYIHIMRGTGAGQTRKINSNDGQTFYGTRNWSINPDATSEYVLFGTPYWAAVGTTGIDQFTTAGFGAYGIACVSQPAIMNNIVYFPQGDSTGIARMQWNGATKVHDFATEAVAGNQGTARFMETGFDIVDGPQMWRANNAAGTGSGGAMTVSRANGTTWGTNLIFRLPNVAGTTGIYIGGTSSKITGMKSHDGTLYVHKENGLFIVSQDRATERRYAPEYMPSIYNGVAMASNEQFLYMAFWTNLMQLAGSAVIDTRLWLNNLPASRVGHVVGISVAFGWMFFAYDAGDEGTSAVMAWNAENQAFHEILRGYKSGARIQNVFWQPCEDTNPRLFSVIGGELVFQVFPRNPRPLADDTILYSPEFVLETSTIDLLNTNSKYFGTLTAVTKNLSRSGHFIELDYITDNLIDSGSWIHAGTIVESPQDKVKIGTGNKRKIRLRFRGLCQDLRLPPVLENFGLALFERKEPPEYFTLVCKTSPNQKVKNSGADDHPPSDLLKALQEMNKRAEVLSVASIDPELNGQAVTMYLAPNVVKDNYNFFGKWSGTISVYLFKEIQ